MNPNKPILLIMPNSKWNDKPANPWTIIPYNLCLLAAILEPYYPVEILDANFDDLSPEQFMNKLRSIDPSIVGITAHSDYLGPAAHAAAKMIKTVSKEMVTVLGGIYAIINPGESITDPNIDYVVIGEGEAVIKELVDAIFGKGPFPDKGYAFKNDNRSIVLPRAEFIVNLDSLPFPAYDKIDFNRYSTFEGRDSAFKPPALPYGRIMTSRGCHIGCIFCQNEFITGKSIRYRSIENTLKEIEWMIEKYGIKSLLIDDANFTADMRRAKTIIREMIARKYNLKWKAHSLAVFYMDEELLELMKMSGCGCIDLAIESGVERVLKEIIRKPVKHKHVIKIIEKARSLEMEISANFVIGFPGETWEEILQTLLFAQKIDVDYVKIMVAMPFRHTKLHEIAAANGCLRDDFSFSDMQWGRGEIRTNEFDPVELNILRTYEWERINFTDPARRERAAKILGVSMEKLNETRKSTRENMLRELMS